MPETIVVEGKLLCCILRNKGEAQASGFITAPEVELQVGHIAHPRGHGVRRHVHPPAVRQVVGTTEVLVVQRGRCLVDVYDDRHRLAATRELASGDVVILFGCGHGLQMLEDTVFLEVKQGPFLGARDKLFF